MFTALYTRYINTYVYIYAFKTIEHNIAYLKVLRVKILLKQYEDIQCIRGFVNFNVYHNATKPNNELWSNTIIYKVYPRSFKDSNKDGISDLKGYGITHKLDHFVDLGIETLWVGPFFKSPMDDMRYDVEDFYMIDSLFGMMSDLEKLIFEMNKRNLKLIIDLIPNHSSYKCEWFQKSIKQERKYKDYNMWRYASNQDEVLTNSSVTPIAPNIWAKK
ncbi:hypothetical protein AGLY_002480 [Aphis glycines]|uniref:alpha-glucosidase n=1 Tax=Aphis glycines TaxID=307491 RepID=A0A6G0U1R9_APHGL|nr:hypothetical protein AGLY_002480 [Aphis glycines]